MYSADPQSTIKKLQEENARLRADINRLQHNHDSNQQHHLVPPTNKQRSTTHGNNNDSSKAHLSIVVIGASGDLAVKKTYPALFSLYIQNLLPKNLHIVGYARSKLEHDKFIDKISSKFSKDADKDKKSEFLSLCTYVSGQYNSDDDFKNLHSKLIEHEKSYEISNRVFYFAIPPNVFVDVAYSINHSALSDSGSNKIIVEKPFGRDLQSSNELQQQLSAVWREDQIYRIDHYLGKEMVQNLMVLRFANKVFEPLWSNRHIKCVLITFKENFGTQGRGGYVQHNTLYNCTVQQCFINYNF